MPRTTARAGAAQVAIAATSVAAKVATRTRAIARMMNEIESPATSFDLLRPPRVRAADGSPGPQPLPLGGRRGALGRRADRAPAQPRASRRDPPALERRARGQTRAGT